MPLRVVLVGAGTMGRIHAEAYRQIPEAALTAVVDPGPAGAELAARHGVAAFRRLDDVVAAYDVLDVTVPTAWHPSLVVAGLADGRAVLCEKPIALTLDDADRMLDAANRAGGRLGVGHVVRYFPEYVAAHDAVTGGDLGDVAVARMFRGGPFPRGWNDWYADDQQSGGPFVDLVIHDFDFLLWTFGPAERVSARAVGGVAGRTPTVVSAVLRFRSGMVAQVTGSWAHPRFGTRFELAGSKRLMTHDSLSAATLVTDQTGSGESAGVAVPSAPRHASPYVLELADMMEGIAAGRPFRVTAEDAREALRLALAARQAATSGCAVALDERDAR